MPRMELDEPMFDDYTRYPWPQLDECAKGPDTPMDAEHCLDCEYVHNCHSPGMIAHMQEAMP